MKQLLKVKVFNRIQTEKYNEHMEKWRSENRMGISGMPFYPMYVFQKANGVNRKNGYVVSEENSHRFYLTKEEVFTNENLRIEV